MLGKTTENKKGCWRKGAAQPLGMVLGSTLNLTGAIASLVLSSQKESVNPLPFLCTAMITSCLYIASNTYKIYQVYNEEQSEQKQSNHFRSKIEIEKHEKTTLTINR